MSKWYTVRQASPQKSFGCRLCPGSRQTSDQTSKYGHSSTNKWVPKDESSARLGEAAPQLIFRGTPKLTLFTLLSRQAVGWK